MTNQRAYNDDEELLCQVREGDLHAFNVLFHRYYAALCAFAFHYVSMEDAEEICQDLFVWLWNNRTELYFTKSLQAYLFRAVQLRSLSRIDKNTAKKRIERLYWQSHPDVEPQVDDYQVEELIIRIREAVDRLPESYREAFVRHRFHGSTYQEIAQQLHVSPKTVDYRIQRALKLLREDLQEYFPLLLLGVTLP